MHINMNKIGIFSTVKKYCIISLVKKYEIIQYFFYCRKTRLSWQFWDWDIYQKVLSEGYLSEIMLQIL